jgi:hypothetical protein
MDVGETIEGLDVDGRPLRAAVFDEHQVRAAAGLALVLGGIAMAYAALARQYLPIQALTALLALEFALRLGLGLRRSPLGLAARLLTRGQPPQWVSAKPKRFAWTLGLVLALVMTVLTHGGVRGAVPLGICAACLTLMWLEAVLGLCLGCEIHGWLVRRGWIARDEAYEICSRGACRVEAPR